MKVILLVNYKILFKEKRFIVLLCYFYYFWSWLFFLDAYVYVYIEVILCKDVFILFLGILLCNVSVLFLFLSIWWEGVGSFNFLFLRF